MKRSILLLLLLAGLLLSDNSVLYAQELSRLRVDKENLTVGDLINLTIETTSSPDVIVKEPDPKTFLSDFELRNTKKPIVNEKEGRKTTIFQYEITAFSTGDKTIGPVTITLSSPRGETRQVLSDKANLHVMSVLPKDAKTLTIKDIKPPEEASYPPHYYLAGALIGLVIIAATYLLVNLLLKKIRRKKALEEEKRRTPEEIACERLKTLRSSSLIEEGKIKEYYSELSEILRQYIEGRYELQALDMTTTELCKMLKDARIKQSAVPNIRDLLHFCDLVKFAKLVPEESRIHGDYEETQKIIETIKPEGELQCI